MVSSILEDVRFFDLLGYKIVPDATIIGINDANKIRESDLEAIFTPVPVTIYQGDAGDRQTATELTVFVRTDTAGYINGVYYGDVT